VLEQSPAKRDRLGVRNKKIQRCAEGQACPMHRDMKKIEKPILFNEYVLSLHIKDQSF
jgi:hypothetical protein